MIEQNVRGMENKSEINPYVSKMANRLMKTAAQAEMKFDSTGWELITEVLSYAASAEQRMSEQQDRIVYLEQLTVTDELTGILNRRGLRQQMARILASAARHRENGVLGFVDLDGFKQINDSHGHLAGDAVLRYTAATLKSLVRSSDLVARIAGDEFAIVLTRCTEEMGEHRLRQIQHIINETTVKHEGEVIPVSCSVGTRAFNGITDPAELIDGADKAMYEDKLRRATAAE